jgi:phage-related protein
MVIRVPVNLDVTDNDIAESIEDEVGRGARSSGVNRAGRTMGATLGDAVGTSLSDSIQDAIAGAGDGVDLSGFTRDVNGRLRDARGRFVAAGEESGRGFGIGLGRGLRGSGGIETFGQLEFSAARLGAGLTGLLAAITPIGPALGGVAAGALAVAGAAGQAAGAAVSAGGVLASLGLGAVTAQVASIGLTEAFEAQSAAQAELAATGEVSAATQDALTAAMDGLAPAAANVVREVSALTPAWSDLQGTIQQTVFQGIAAQLGNISDAILPTLQRQLTGTSSVLNDAALGFAQFAQSETFVSQLDTILAGLNGTLAALLPGIGGFGRGLLAIFAGGTGPATDMAEAISDVGENFGTWAQGIAESGQLVAFLDQANIVLGDLLGIVGNIGSILVTVLGAGAGAGAGLLSTFRDLTGQLAAFVQTAGAQAGLADFFGLISQTGQTVAELGSVIGPVFAGLFAVIGQLLPQINALRDALLPVAVALGEALGTALTGLAPVIGLVAQVIVGLVQALAPLVITIVSALGPALAQIGALFRENLAPAIQELAPLLAPLGALLLDLFGAQVVSAIGLLVDVIGGLFNVLGGLITFLTGVFTGDWETAWAGIQQVFAGVVDVVIGLVAFLIRSITAPFRTGLRAAGLSVEQFWGLLRIRFRQGIVNAISAVTGFVSGVRSRIVGLGVLVASAARSMWARVVSFFTSGILRARSAVTSGVRLIVARFVDLRSSILGTVSGFGSLLFNAGRNVVQGLINGIRSLIGSVGSAMSDIASTIRSYLPFSPAEIGPLSGAGSPDNSGEAIARMIADGIQQNVNLPARAMQRALAPLTPSELAPAAFGASGAVQRAPVASTADAGVQVTQVFNGPTTSGGRLAEMEWNLRYATQARREVIGGVPTA